MSEALRVQFTQSARRHRIGKAHPLRVMTSCEPEVIPTDANNRERLVWVGEDDRGLTLEIAAIVEVNCLLVVHVMPYQFRRRET